MHKQLTSAECAAAANIDPAAGRALAAVLSRSMSGGASRSKIEIHGDIIAALQGVVATGLRQRCQRLYHRSRLLARWKRGCWR